MIRYANHKDLKGIAKIHKESYPEDHFLNELSLDLIANYYGSFLKYRAIFLVCVIGGRICGFLVGGEGYILNKARNDFIKQNKCRLTLYVIARLFSMKFMRGFLPRFVNLVQNRLCKQLDKRDLSRSKVSYHGLFSIAVANEMKGKNLGKVLLDSFEDELRKMRVEKYVVSVRKNNLRAIKFYRKSGFCLQKETATDIRMYKTFSL